MNENIKNIYVLGGGTVYHIRPHLALCAPAYGTTASYIANQIDKWLINQGLEDEYLVNLALTRMAYKGNKLTDCIGDTNTDVEKYINKLLTKQSTNIIFMNAALCDYEGHILNKDNGYVTGSGKDQPRLKTQNGNQLLSINPAEKLIRTIRKERKDIFLVAFKTTSGVSEEEQFKAGLDLLKKNSCNLVLANDVHSRRNMIITPEQAKYYVTTDRNFALNQLVDMAMLRSRNTFTRTTVAPGDIVSFETDERIPDNLRRVVNWAVKQNAYKPFNGSTVGHYGVRIGPSALLSSRRGQNYNNGHAKDMVKVQFDGDRAVAYGAKPSAGARSQHEVLSHYPDLNCIIHFHCPLRDNLSKVDLNQINVVPQRNYQCGSYDCGQNTLNGLQKLNEHIAVVMLDKHGPNIVFSDKADTNEVCQLIDKFFDLSKSTQ